MIESAVERVAETYPHTRVPVLFKGKHHRVTIQDVLDILPNLKRSSSPGLPWAALAKTKGEIVDNHSMLLAQAVLARLDVLESVDLSLYSDPCKCVDDDLCDPVRLFVKNEPHTQTKASEERWRLISSVSIEDEIIERLLCSKQNEAEIENWLTCPSKPGIGLSLDEQSLAFFKSMEERLGEAHEADVRGWDNSVKYWMYEFDVQCRIRLCGASKESAFAKILRARFWCLARSVFSTSDGKLFKQLMPGWMKSGSYITSSTNSRMRVGLAYILGAKWCVAMGDDSLESYVADAIAKYDEFGIDVKMYRECGSSFEFCSNRFVDGVAVPLNWAKGLYRLLCSAPSMERLEQFEREYRHSPELDRCMGFILREWTGLGNLT